MRRLFSILALSLLALAGLGVGAAPLARAEAPPRRAASARAATPSPASSPALSSEKGGGRGRKVLTGVANLNQASAETLELLPFIGPARAQAIVEFRAKRPFKKVEDLLRIRGIGKKTLARMKPYVSVSGATTLVDEKADTSSLDDAP